MLEGKPLALILDITAEGKRSEEAASFAATTPDFATTAPPFATTLIFAAGALLIEAAELLVESTIFERSIPAR